MGSNVGEHMNISGNDTAECSETTVEIKIKTLDSRTYTLRVDKCVSVPELKEQIASVTGVLSEQQRLICRGKVLKDDQLLSAYHVEDGHTLHLVVRQPVAPSADSSDHPATDPTSGTDQNPGSRVSPGMVVGTFNIPEQGDGAFPDINRIISAVLNSFGATRFGSGGEGIDLNQPPSERPSTASGLSGTRSSSRQSDQLASVAIPVEPLQPPVIPDSWTTLLQYSNQLRQEFSAYAGGASANARNFGFPGSDGEATSEPRRLLTPESLAEVMSSARQLLAEQATECLSQLAGQIESHSSVMDPLERSRIQSNAIRSGGLFQNLGALLLELGRAIMTLRMGQIPADALVNAGPSVFISSTGPNPIMVQPLPFQPGSSFGSVPVGTVQHGSGLGGGSAGTGFLPRNIDIRIRTGSLFARREPTGSQPQGQTGTPSSNGGHSGQQDAAPADPNLRSREPLARAIPLRTVVAAVPASVGRSSSDTSRGSIGFLYPVLARVQHLSSGNSNGSRSTHTPNQHHDQIINTEQPVSESSAQQPSNVNPTGNGSSSSPSEAFADHGFAAQIRDGLEQLLSTMFPGAHVNDNTEPTGSGSVPSHTDPAQNIGSSQESASDVSEEGIILSSILRQIMPMLSDNMAAEPNTPPSGRPNSDEPQADGNTDEGSSSRRRRGSQSQASSKRRRRE